MMLSEEYSAWISVCAHDRLKSRGDVIGQLRLRELEADYPRIASEPLSRPFTAR